MPLACPKTQTEGRQIEYLIDTSWFELENYFTAFLLLLFRPSYYYYYSGKKDLSSLELSTVNMTM